MEKYKLAWNSEDESDRCSYFSAWRHRYVCLIVFDRAKCEDFLAAISESVALISLIGEVNLMIRWIYSTMWVMVMASWARIQKLLRFLSD